MKSPPLLKTQTPQMSAYPFTIYLPGMFWFLYHLCCVFNKSHTEMMLQLFIKQACAG